MVAITHTKVHDIPPLSTTGVEAVSSPPPLHDNSNGKEALIITPACYQRIKKLASRKDGSLEHNFLRVYVDAGGCSGFSYKFEFDTELIESEDVVFSDPADSATRLVVDTDSLQYIQGSTIDFVQEMIKSSFEVRDNPQSESACGCGSSFAVKNFSANPALD